VLEVSEQGYYQWLKRPNKNARQIRESFLRRKIRIVFHEHARRYGSPRIYQELLRQDIKVGENYVAKLMRLEGLRAKGAPTRKRTTTPNRATNPRYAENILARKFDVQLPNQVWCGDITYINTGEGFAYLAVFLDLYSRKVVGWELSSRLTKALVLTAFNQAVILRKPDSSLILHTDRGSQYSSDKFREIVQETNGLTLSMSRKGNCWDNAVVESFFASLKRERIRGEKIVSRRHLHVLLSHYIENYYNQIRLHSTLDYLSPKEYEFVNVAD
jgi:transposase InsO family protein